jgi:hypothetical protein
MRRGTPKPTARHKVRKRRMAGWNSLFTIKSFFNSRSSLEDSLPDLCEAFLFCSLLSTKL